MPTERSAPGIALRFDEERDYIDRYVRFLRAKSTIHDQHVQVLNRILARCGIDPLPTRRYDRISQPFSPEEMGELLAAICHVEPELYQTILGHEQRLDDIPSLGLDGPAAGHLDRLHEWVDYFMERLSDDPEAEELDVAIGHAMRQAEEVEQQWDEEDRIPPDALRVFLTTSADHAIHAKVRQRIDALVYAREQFEEIEVLARVGAPDAEINVLRQGFLLLMTAFDAAVFDLVRVKLRKDFFGLIGCFGKSEKVTLQEIGDAGSFETFRDQIIEEQLKSRYIKDLLFLLEGQGVKCVHEAAGGRFIQLIELVLRRNVHVHNRGVVDERYLERDQRGQPKYNLYNLSLGDVARIDETYWELANRLTAQCVTRVTDWANS